MNNPDLPVAIKPKEPLLAILLAYILPGLGQVYSKRIARGIVLFCIQMIGCMAVILYMYNPFTAINFSIYGFFLLACAFHLFIVIDSYFCARTYNIIHNIQRKVSIGKRILWILAIVAVALGANPSSIIYLSLSAYVKTNITQAFKIPGDSMKPTLVPGDCILVDKVIYKRSAPKRGDVIVYNSSRTTGKVLISRLVGLPLETIQIANGRIIINGFPVDDKKLSGRLYRNKGDFVNAVAPMIIPENSYYVLSDNTESNADSRIFGFVLKKNLLGKAYKIYYPFDRIGFVK